MTVTDSGQVRTVAFASAVGTTIEWYDYFIFSTGAALIFSDRFFADLPAASAVMASFATLGVGILARPFGGVLWGHFGDRLGRKGMLVTSLLLMGLATAGVGLLPSYQQVGVWSPVLLVLLRLLQGVSAGGEWGGAALMAVEHAPEGRQGRYGSFSQIGVPAGLILSQLVFLAMSSVTSKEEFTSWGWRVPFLLSLVLVAIGLVIRLRVAESPVFRALSEEDRRSRAPVREVFRLRSREVLLAAASFVANTAVGYIFLAYLLSYGTSVLHVGRNLMLLVVIVGSLTWLVAIVASAEWSDRVGRKRPYLIGSILLVAWAIPLFLLIDTRVLGWMIVAVVVLNVGLGLTYGPQSALFAALFEPRYRYSGVSISYALGAVVGGGFAPLIATWLQKTTGTSMAVSGYLIVVGLISLAAVLAIREPRTHDHLS
ncbi:MAG TPA: MFS transporter [Pseudonocardia sp.]|nr:MFS transporter [Pseudonocardia sp.]